MNILEAASELAHEVVCVKFKYDNKLIYVEDADGTIYTEKAQDLFNEWYDHYYDFLTKLAIS